MELTLAQVLSAASAAATALRAYGLYLFAEGFPRYRFMPQRPCRTCGQISEGTLSGKLPSLDSAGLSSCCPPSSRPPWRQPSLGTGLNGLLLRC